MEAATFASLTSDTEVLTQKEKADVFYVITHQSDDNAKCDSPPQCAFPRTRRCNNPIDKLPYDSVPRVVECSFVGLILLLMVLIAVNIRMYCSLNV